jgi:RNA polymerase sigma factor (sigma-70 family)
MNRKGSVGTVEVSKLTSKQEEWCTVLRELRGGSSQAFDRFYEQFASLVYTIALNMLGDRMEAEDVCHDVFLEVYNKADQYNPARGSVEAWLAVKTRSRCLDRLKKKRPLCVDKVGEEAEWHTTPLVPTEELVLAKLEQETLHLALNHLPEPQREALRGMYFESRTQQELAARMNRPLGTVKSFVRYGLQNLRKQLHQLGWIQSTGGGKRHE